MMVFAPPQVLFWKPGALRNDVVGQYGSVLNDGCLVEDLSKLPWDSIQATQWAGAYKEGKQSEFLLEEAFPWSLVECIGVYGEQEAGLIAKVLEHETTKPAVKVRRDWYY